MGKPIDVEEHLVMARAEIKEEQEKAVKRLERFPSE